jgi:Protein of unknown function (DUF4229)
LLVVKYPLSGLLHLISESVQQTGLSSMVVVGHNASTRRTLARDLALYSVARLALVTVVALLLMLVGVPLLVSALLAMVLALPLSMLLLGRLRGRVNTGLAVVAERRKAERDRLRQQLQGESHR